MTGRRGVTWAAGLVAAATLAAFLPWDDESRAASGLALILAVAAPALIGEAAALRTLASHPRRPPRPPEGARPPDGVVEVVAMAGVESAANDADPRWRRFVRLTLEGPAPNRRGVRGREHPLLGRVALVSVFVGRDGRAWGDPAIVRAHEALERAGAWIEREAGCWGAPVNVALPDVYFRAEDDADEAVELAFQPEGDDVGPMEAGAALKDAVSASRVAARLGFADVLDLVATVDSKVDADVRVWLFHVLRSGRSHAIPASDPDGPGVGLAICYAREASFPEPLARPDAARVDPVTVVHELFHLFGASDKYGVALDAFPPGSVGPRDVMRLDQEWLDRLRVGALTAAEVGWVDPREVGRRETPAANRGGRGGRG